MSKAFYQHSTREDAPAVPLLRFYGAEATVVLLRESMLVVRLWDLQVISDEIFIPGLPHCLDLLQYSHRGIGVLHHKLLVGHLIHVPLHLRHFGESLLTLMFPLGYGNHWPG